MEEFRWLTPGRAVAMQGNVKLVVFYVSSESQWYVETTVYDSRMNPAGSGLDGPFPDSDLAIAFARRRDPNIDQVGREDDEQRR